VLETVAADEVWHLDWIRAKLAALTADDPVARARADAVGERYREIEAAVYRELAAVEAEAFRE
jgi:hypothetical protein